MVVELGDSKRSIVVARATQVLQLIEERDQNCLDAAKRAALIQFTVEIFEKLSLGQRTGVNVPQSPALPHGSETWSFD